MGKPKVRVSGLQIGSEQLRVLSAEATGGREALTPAERDVVGLVLAGQSNVEVAAVRGTSARTIANQLQSIYRKLNVSDRQQLARAVAEER